MNDIDIFTAVSPHSVKKYIIKGKSSNNDGNLENDPEIERWIIVGTDKNYIVKDDFCTCYSFILDNLKKNNICKHIKLLKESQKSKQYDSFIISFSEYEIYRDEWLKEK
jgi:predicted nucleic acid-binding Zn finger protein